MRRPADAWSAAVVAARTGFAEYRALLTWRSWVFGWLLRLFSQAIFFTAFGILLRSKTFVHYIAIGNTVMLVCMEAIAVIPTLASDRFTGIRGLQLAAPTSFAFTSACRTIYCPAIGVLTSSIAFFSITRLFGVRMNFPQAAFAPAIIGVVGLATYAFGFALACVVLTLPSLQAVVMNLSYLILMTFAGVNVPTAFWPAPVRLIAQFLPLTHGLGAIRSLVAGAPLRLVLPGVLLEAVVAGGWFAAGAAVLKSSTYVGRRTGRLELSG
ncbi:MAG TPA: ABC transporter permease [Streptosporangiaceae bacterium]|nr:ABC transporter permease [Streptosporangiaceae bacterium]